MKYFLLFFSLFILFFSTFLLILLDEITDFETLGPFGYILIAFRTSVGDFNIDSYSPNSEFKILTWIAWLLTMIVGYVIFMNFIIAVVNESYENCMMQMVAQS